jgi:DNA-directed RNA polymerase subunit alpha
VLDRNMHIATVGEGGYAQHRNAPQIGPRLRLRDRNFDEDLPHGLHPIDSVHSPVRKVNFSVEAARLGQMTDYDKLILEVWTNGAISPAGLHRTGREAAQGSHVHLHQLRGTPRNGRRGAERAMDQMNES